MYYGSEEYVDAVFEQGFQYAKQLRPDASMVTWFHMAEQFAKKAEKKQKAFYQGTSKYQPHQGKKEMARRMKQMKPGDCEAV
jgi:hypothetical protein